MEVLTHKKSSTKLSNDLLRHHPSQFKPKIIWEDELSPNHKNQFEIKFEEIVRLRDGSSFGELALLKDKPR